MAIQVLSLRTALPKMIKAFNERRLQAQQAKKQDVGEACLYSIDGDKGRKDCGCAIGVSLTKATRKAVLDADKNGASIRDLRSVGLIKVDYDDFEVLARLQEDHDTWVASNGADYRRSLRLKFATKLNRLRKELGLTECPRIRLDRLPKAV